MLSVEVLNSIYPGYHQNMLPFVLRDPSSRPPFFWLDFCFGGGPFALSIEAMCGLS